MTTKITLPPRAQATIGSERRYKTLSDEAKDIIFDTTNQVFHDMALLWQFIDQNDPEEAEDTIANVEGRLAEIREQMEIHRLAVKS